MTYAIVENGVVTNVIDWDGLTPWTPPSGSIPVVIPDGAYVGIGSTYDASTNTFGAPPQPSGGI